MSQDPIEIFSEWFSRAKTTEPEYPDAMSLATVGSDGFPHCRIVLLKSFDQRGFVFYTNLESDKARQIQYQQNVALCFHWKTQNRQVRIEGVAEPVSQTEADTYFASRNRLSQIGAWASKQSRPLESRFELEKRVAQLTAKFHLGEVPRPEFWSGYRVVPRRVEFWEEKRFRLHDRLIFKLNSDQTWENFKIFP